MIRQVCGKDDEEIFSKGTLPKIALRENVLFPKQHMPSMEEEAEVDIRLTA